MYDSNPIPLDAERTSMISPTDFARLERKVDKLTAALDKLILIEERQSRQTERMAMMEKDLEVVTNSLQMVDRKVDQWVNRGMGAWAIAVTVWIVIEFVVSKGIIKM